jgi:hypothetical protein
MHSNLGALILYLLSGSALASAIPTQTQTHDVTLVARATAIETAAPEGWFTTTKNIATIGGVTDKYVTIPAKTISIVVPTCVQTLEPDENGYLPPGTCNAHWNYYPSFAAALAFALLFATLTGVHIWQAARYKKVRMFYFCCNLSGMKANECRHGVGLLSWRGSGKPRRSPSER